MSLVLSSPLEKLYVCVGGGSKPVHSTDLVSCHAGFIETPKASFIWLPHAPRGAFRVQCTPRGSLVYLCGFPPIQGRVPIRNRLFKALVGRNKRGLVIDRPSNSDPVGRLLESPEVPLGGEGLLLWFVQSSEVYCR